MFDCLKGMDGLDLLLAVVGVLLIVFALDYVRRARSETSETVKKIMTKRVWR